MPQILIEPWHDATHKALQIVQQKDPQLVRNVTKIIVHSGPSNQLGHVEMGPGKDPTEIHIFKDRIKEIVIQQAGGNTNKQTLSHQELEDAIIRGIVETVAHEAFHIGKYRGIEEIKQGPFLGEQEAERGARELMQKIQSDIQLSKRAQEQVVDNEEEEARNLAENDPKMFFNLGLHKKYKNLERLIAEDFMDEESPDDFFNYDLDNKYPDLKRMLAEQFIENGNIYNFFIYKLNESFPDLEKLSVKQIVDRKLLRYFFDFGLNKKEEYKELTIGLIKKLIKERPDLFFYYNLHKKYPNLCKKYMQMAPLGFKSDQDSSQNNFYSLTPSLYKGLHRPLEYRTLERYEFTINNPFIVNKNKLEKNILSDIYSKAGEDVIHSVGLHGLTKSFGLVSFPDKETMIVEQLQSDVPPTLYKLHNNKNKKQQIINQYGNDNYKEFIQKYSKYAILYPYITLGKIVDFTKLNNIKTIKIPDSEYMERLIAKPDVNLNKLDKIYRELPKKLGFKHENRYYVYSDDMQELENNINKLQQEEENKLQQHKQPKKTPLSKRDKPRKSLDIEKVREKLQEILGDRSKHINVSDNPLITIKSLNMAVKNKHINKKEMKLLLGIIPRLTIASIEDMMIKVAEYVDPIKEKFNLSKRAGKIVTKDIKSNSNNSFIKTIQSDIKDANKFNKIALNSKNTLNNLGIITSHIDLNNLSITLANWQYDNNLEPNGILDNKTLNKFKELKLDTTNFPRNFSKVSKNIYRGGIIDNIDQLKALKDLGVERIISLHNHPSVSRMCGKLNMEHVPAYMTNGKSHELGRKMFGDSVSNILDYKPCYVHCMYGSDRTGAIIAKYRVENGWSPELAYKEAKSFGFKDMFADLIDWFSDGNPPIDTEKVRKIMNYEDPYQCDMEQDCFTPMPDDMPFINNDESGYTNEITKLTPTSFTVPLSVRNY